MVVYCGEQDEKVRSVDLAAWRLQTTAGFRLRSFPGNHFFFLNESRDRVTQAIAEDVARVAGENGPLPLEAGRPQLEAAIAGVWRDVLGTANVGLDDNFFDLGGNSVLMLEVHAHLRRTVGMTLPVLDLFQYPTVRLLAGKLQSQPGRPATAWGNVDIRRAHPPSDRASEEKRP
jgi:hypothetical protein